MRFFLSLLFLGLGSGLVRAEVLFEKEIRPLLVKHCTSCHGPEKQKAGLRLDSKSGWQTGGENGPAIVPGMPETSLLIRAIQGTEGHAQMPPRGKLSDREIAILTTWVKEGANAPRDNVVSDTTTFEARKKHWSFQPLKRPPVPMNRFAYPVDAFITAKLAEKQLALSLPADRRTLIRRATYDLTGLPPTPGEMEAFVKDEAPDAFARVVERLLASSAYGERWGRHWLDLVRYADTAGENSDHPLPHAWRYRNWVIDAVNRDQPYDEFLREQIAGDLLATEGPPEKYANRTIATGFLALARRFDHDSDKFMHLTHEDGIDTLGQALLGLTLGCARCHDHKYDAITARDYYALYGIFESTKFAFPGCEAKQQPRDLVPLRPAKEWEQLQKPHREKLARIESDLQANQTLQTQRAQRLKEAYAKSVQLLASGEIPDGGEQKFEKLPAKIEIRVGEMVQLSVLPLKNHGADTTLVEWEIAEVGGPQRRWNVTADLIDDLLAGNPHPDRQGHKEVWWFLDTRNGPLPLPEPIRDLSGKAGLNVWRNGDTPSLLVNSAQDPAGVWTTLPARSLFVHPAPNGDVAIGWLSPITGAVTITGRVKDAHPGGPDGVGWRIDRIAADLRPELHARVADSAQRRVLDQQKADLLRNAPKQEVAYAVVEGKPADARLHRRGDPEKLGEVVPRRWLEVLGGNPITPQSGSGRLDLAHWVTAKDNPLTARVMVNRIWLHHFGKGLVRTPNDFGTRGLAPTHPELLDWLTSKFIDSGWSLKAMHRTILLSATYQQANQPRAEAEQVDAGNDLYWRFDRRRLSAEELRDSLLVASAQLDRTSGEAHPFPPESSWNYTQHVPFSTFFETNKRSVYLVNVRNRRHPFLGLFDGADPNATTPQRQTTTVPTQALYFLNDSFFHKQADQVAGRVIALPEPERLGELFRIALQRSPTEKDIAFAIAFLDRYRSNLSDVPESERSRKTWAALSRIVLASNEFLFVE